MTPEQRMRETGERLVEVIARQEWLNPWGYKLEHVMAVGWDLLGGRRDRVRNVLHGTWLGHPLHPVLTDVPLGAWTTAFALDCLDSRSRDGADFAGAARLALGIGIIGGVGAAMTGLTDWQYTHDDARRTGLVHGLLNLGALGLSAWSWSRRRSERDSWSRLASGLGYGTALFSGFLGGNLVFRERIGVDRTEHPMEPREFVPVLFENELADDRLQHVRAGDADVILLRSGGRLHAYGEHCPHLGAPLSDGWLSNGSIVCPCHGARFELSTGSTVKGPATSPLTCFETCVRGGRIEVRLPAPEDAAVPRKTARQR